MAIAYTVDRPSDTLSLDDADPAGDLLLVLETDEDGILTQSSIRVSSKVLSLASIYHHNLSYLIRFTYIDRSTSLPHSNYDFLSWSEQRIMMGSSVVVAMTGFCC